MGTFVFILLGFLLEGGEEAKRGLGAFLPLFQSGVLGGGEEGGREMVRD